MKKEQEIVEEDDEYQSVRAKETLSELLAVELEPVASANRKTIKSFYKAMASNDTEMVSRLVAADLEWWFHGPPHCQHMMRTLTGEYSKPSEGFKFRPRRVMAFSDRVIVDGWRRLREGSTAAACYWAHVWTLEGGVMTQLREYFDTWLTVIVRVSNGDVNDQKNVVRILWQSTEAKERLNLSLPDVVLPI